MPQAHLRHPEELAIRRNSKIVKIEVVQDGFVIAVRESHPDNVAGAVGGAALEQDARLVTIPLVFSGGCGNALGMRPGAKGANLQRLSIAEVGGLGGGGGDGEL